MRGGFYRGTSELTGIIEKNPAMCPVNGSKSHNQGWIYRARAARPPTSIGLVPVVLTYSAYSTTCSTQGAVMAQNLETNTPLENKLCHL